MRVDCLLGIAKMAALCAMVVQLITARSMVLETPSLATLSVSHLFPNFCLIAVFYSFRILLNLLEQSHFPRMERPRVPKKSLETLVIEEKKRSFLTCLLRT